MLNKNKLLELIHVKPEEAKLVFLTFLFTLWTGSVLNIVNSVPMAMFLSHYGSFFLPHIFIGSGISILFAGIALAYLQKKVTIFHVLTALLAIFQVHCSFSGRSLPNITAILASASTEPRTLIINNRKIIS